VFPRLVLGREPDRQHLGEIALPEAAPLGQLERRANPLGACSRTRGMLRSRPTTTEERSERGDCTAAPTGTSRAGSGRTHAPAVRANWPYALALSAVKEPRVILRRRAPRLEQRSVRDRTQVGTDEHPEINASDLRAIKHIR
jgi:hypothetical protein